MLELCQIRLNHVAVSFYLMMRLCWLGKSCDVVGVEGRRSPILGCRLVIVATLDPFNEPFQHLVVETQIRVTYKAEYDHAMKCTSANN